MKKILSLILALVLVISMLPTAFAFDVAYMFVKTYSSKDKTTLNVGETTCLDVSIYPADADDNITWSSNNPNVLKVDYDYASSSCCDFKAVSPGTAYVTARAKSGVTAGITVTVLSGATSISLAGNTTLKAGQTAWWSASVSPSSANQWVTWTSGNPGVATIDQDGYIRALKPGQSHITATAANGVKKTVTLTVIASELVLNGATTVNAGQTIKWTANQSVWWTSGNPGVATIDQNGNIKALRVGQSHITATTSSGAKKTVMLTVRQNEVTLAGNALPLPGMIVKWTANQWVSWTSGNPSVATIDQYGNIHAIKTGKSHITATAADGTKKTVTLNVLSPMKDLDNVGDAYLYTTSLLTDNKGNTYASAVYFDDNYSEDTLEYITNKQYSRFRATLYMPEGKTGPRYFYVYGDGKLIYTSPSMYSDSAPVNVDINISNYNRIEFEANDGYDAVYLANAGFLKADIIQLNGSSTISIGQTVKWTADRAVWWSSGNPGVATIDQNGNIKALKAGQSHITATANDGNKKTVTLTVLSNDIALKGSVTALPGQTVRWTADRSVWWSSGNPGVATIDQNGNIKALKAGQTHITATASNGAKKTITFTVLVALKDLYNSGDTSLYSESSSSYLTDTKGNKYDNAVYFDDDYDNDMLEYVTGGIYSRFKAIFYIPKNGYGPRYFTMYGDGKLIYTSPTLYSSDAPVNIDVNVSGYNRIEFLANDGYDDIYLANAGFIKPAPLQTSGSASAYAGQTIKWTADRKVWWSSGNTAVATIDQNGNIKALKAGQTHITATANDGARKTVMLTVLPVETPTYLSAFTSLINNGKMYITDSAALTNSFGNSYSSGVYFFAGQGDLVFNQNMNYNRFRATLYRPKGSTGNTRQLQIYGDGKLLYSSPYMYSNSTPVNIDISVKGYRNITFRASSSDPVSDAVHLASAAFYK